MPLIVSDISFEYFQGNPVLRNTSIEVARGEIVAIVGPSGCGKTTLLHCIAGFITPSSGSIQVEGRDVLLEKPHLRGVGIMMQDQPLYEHLTVEQNIAFPLRSRGDKKGVLPILELLQLQTVAHQKVSRCSGGERRRVAFGRAIALQPHVLLLDEPFVSLNEEIRSSIKSYLRRTQQTQSAVLMVSHDLGEAKEASDRIIRMEAQC